MLRPRHGLAWYCTASRKQPSLSRAQRGRQKKSKPKSDSPLLSSHSPSCPFQLGSRGWFVLVAWSPPSTNRPTPEPTDGMPAAPTCCSAMWLACRGSTLSWTPHTAALLFDRHQARRARRHALPLRHGRQGKQENSPPHAKSRGQPGSEPAEPKVGVRKRA